MSKILLVTIAVALSQTAFADQPPTLNQKEREAKPQVYKALPSWKKIEFVSSNSGKLKIEDSNIAKYLASNHRLCDRDANKTLIDSAGWLSVDGLHVVAGRISKVETDEGTAIVIPYVVSLRYAGRQPKGLESLPHAINGTVNVPGSLFINEKEQSLQNISIAVEKVDANSRFEEDGLNLLAHIYKQSMQKKQDKRDDKAFQRVVRELLGNFSACTVVNYFAGQQQNTQELLNVVKAAQGSKAN